MGNCIFLRRGAPPSSGPQLGDLEPGSLIGIEENGTQVPFIVLAHGYPAAERTLVLRQDCYDERIFNNGNSFNNSYIYNWLNNNYLALLSSDVQSMIDTVTIKCVRGSGSGMLIDVSAKIFLLSGVETGCDAGYMSGSEGEAIPYFNSNLRRIAYLNQTPVVWWTRSPYYFNTSDMWVIPEDGDSAAQRETANNRHECGSRPAFTLPVSMKPIIWEDV